MGGGGGSVSSIDLSKLTDVAERRLKQLAQGGTRILFACERVDRKALESHLARSASFDPKKYEVVDASSGMAYEELVRRCSMVVVFTAEAKDTTYLDRIVERTLELKKQGVHAKAADDSNIPAKATAYRWPSLRWSKLEDMFA